MAFADDLTLRALTDAEAREVAGDKRILAIQLARPRRTGAKAMTDIRQVEREAAKDAEIERHMREKVALAALVSKERDDNERLREQVASLQASSGYEASIAQVEIERLRKIEPQFDALKEERVRWFADNEWLTADNERLRAALQRIAYMPATIEAKIDLARAALEPKP